MHNYDMDDWDEFDNVFQKMMRPFKGLDEIGTTSPALRMHRHLVLTSMGIP